MQVNGSAARTIIERLSAIVAAGATVVVMQAPTALAACDPATEVSFGGFCYYLDGSGGVCDPGYQLASQSVLTSIAGNFLGKTYKHIISFNCCIYNSDPDMDWGMTTNCNDPGPFAVNNPFPGGAGCSNVSFLGVQQLTLCVSSTPLASCGDTVLDPGEQCDDGNLVNGDCCSSVCQFEATGTICRASAGSCDLAETCSGISAACPADAKSAAECRAAAGNCDLAEVCDGVANACPVDVKSTAVCRAAAGDCDAAEACDGVIDVCPNDADQPDGTGCDDGDACSQTDTCVSGGCNGSDPLDCEDASLCTVDSCDPIDGCVNDDAPAAGCLTATKSIVLIKDSDDDTKDKLLWKWIKGDLLMQGDLADPITTADYAVCVYAGTANALVADAALPASAEWQTVGTKGYKFKGTSPNGLSLVLLKGGAAGKSKALAKGKGGALPDPDLPLAYPVIVQLKKAGSPLCLESSFSTLDEKKNTLTQFKAKH